MQEERYQKLRERERICERQMALLRAGLEELETGKRELEQAHQKLKQKMIENALAEDDIIQRANRLDLKDNALERASTTLRESILKLTKAQDALELSMLHAPGANESKSMPNGSSSFSTLSDSNNSDFGGKTAKSLNSKRSTRNLFRDTSSRSKLSKRQFEQDEKLITCGYLQQLEGRRSMLSSSRWRKRFVALHEELGIGIFADEEKYIRGEGTWYDPQDFVVELRSGAGEGFDELAVGSKDDISEVATKKSPKGNTRRSSSTPHPFYFRVPSSSQQQKSQDYMAAKTWKSGFESVISIFTGV